MKYWSQPETCHRRPQEPHTDTLLAKVASDSLKALQPLIRAQSDLSPQEGLLADSQVLDFLSDTTVLERLDNLIMSMPLVVIRS